jgi:predicted  nucleic acid-binding Zn-ribbon protein
MNRLVRTTLNLEQYRCLRCGRLFYVNAMDRGDLDLDVGCPCGCDDKGRHIQDIRTEVTGVRGVK